MINKNEFIADVRHIGWVAYQIAVGQEYNEEINNDQLESLLNGIEYLEENPECSPEENHNNWMEEKTRQGWVYGEIKDFELKTHPDLVPFDELPVVEQRKDIVDAIIHKMATKMWKKYASKYN